MDAARSGGLGGGHLMDADSLGQLEEREVIVAHIWGGLTFEQIGEIAGCSASTAHRQYTAGLTTIRERLGVTEPCRRSRPIPG
jgi:Sigma-70, region 4